MNAWQSTTGRLCRGLALGLCLLALGYAAGCSGPTVHASLPAPGAALPSGQVVRSFTGIASWYGRPFHGRLTASGVRYDMTALTAAHRSLPFGTRLRVTNLTNRRSIVVTVNDRGPFIEGRVLDLSRAAAQELMFIDAGLARVRIDVLAAVGS
ncbi:septal ring lytic transglycosylase RlpA family protein [Pelagibius sp.]|uniref:septal ring lytic transglycosylase RlpA family protein n=1 Tax=Pelagibius sp. TaxID=1931238 RepID=UPI002621E371|nr:septal ring lytic transglycosylase RlpA family protein [Pelagibius sp.]